MAFRLIARSGAVRAARQGSRAFSSRAGTSNSAVFGGAVGVATGVLFGGIAVYAAAPAPEKKEEKKAPVDEKKTATQEKPSGKLTDKQIAAIKEDIIKLLDDNDYDDGSYGPILVRLAWHSSGTFDQQTKRGGSTGAGMRFEHESGWDANAGLHVARNLVEPIKKKHPEISYSDLWVLAGVTAIEAMGGPVVPFRSGRKDVDEPHGDELLPNGLLPDATKGPDHLRNIFYRMGFNDQEIVALSGAHALGRCHMERSGFDGPWTRAPTTFSNEFFRLLLEEKWVEETLKNGLPQYRNPQKDLMMLRTDIALVEDPKFKVYVEQYAKDEELFKKDFAKAFLKLTELGGVWEEKSWWRKIFG